MDQVKEVLKDYPEARNSDITLTILIWKRYYPQRLKQIDGEEVVCLKDLYDLPREDNVKRIRAKLAEEAMSRILHEETKGDEHYYLPTNDKIARQRQINAEDWLRVMGYFKRTARIQDNQLPNPVGGFKVRHIVAMSGSDRKYLVSDGDTNFEIDLIDGKWHCQLCGERCEHIEQITAK